MDAQPNSAPAHHFAHAFANKVQLCYYGEYQRSEVTESAQVRRRAEQGAIWVKPRLDATSRIDITVNRTDSLDQTSTALTGGGVALPGPLTDPEVDEFIRHCVNNVRRIEEAADGTLVCRWIRTGPNDYFHGLNYTRLARDADTRYRAAHPAAPVTFNGVRADRSHLG